MNFSIEENGYSKSQTEQYVTLLVTEYEKLRAYMGKLINDYDALLQQTMSRPSSDTEKFEHLRHLEHAVKEAYNTNQALQDELERMREKAPSEESLIGIAEILIEGRVTADLILEEHQANAVVLLDEARRKADDILREGKQTILREIDSHAAQLARLEQEKSIAHQEIERIKSVLSSLTDLQNTENDWYGKNTGADQSRIYTPVHG